jgi:hypothetical protein
MSQKVWSQRQASTPICWSVSDSRKRGEVAYQFSLQEGLSAVHDVFHVSQLNKCLHVPEEQLPVEDLEVQDRVTRRNTIRMCKVRWGHHSEEEATWVREDDLMVKYPDLFTGQP